MIPDRDRILELEKRVDQLENRLEQLLGAQDGTVLQAPVRVVGQDGRLLLTIEEQTHDLSIKLYNAAGHRAAVLGVDGT